MLSATPLLRAADHFDNDALVAVVCSGGIAALNALVCVHGGLLDNRLTPQQLCALGAKPEGAAALYAASRTFPRLMAHGLTATHCVALVTRHVELPGAMLAAEAQLVALELAPDQVCALVLRCGDPETLPHKLAEWASLCNAGMRGGALASLLARQSFADELPLLLRHVHRLRQSQVTIELTWAALDHADDGFTLEVLLRHHDALRSAGLYGTQLMAFVRAGAAALNEAVQFAGCHANGACPHSEVHAAAQVLLEGRHTRGRGAGPLSLG